MAPALLFIALSTQTLSNHFKVVSDAISLQGGVKEKKCRCFPVGKGVIKGIKIKEKFLLNEMK